MFPPVKHQGALLCDGGLMNNFPVNDFPTEGTLGFRVAWYVDPSPPDNLLTYYTRILACLQVPMELSYQTCDQDKIMTIDVGPMATLRFSVQKSIAEQVSALVLQGYRQSHSFFAKKKHILFKDPLTYING
jgi:predicted acylesterase/phospholipase RssA